QIARLIAGQINRRQYFFVVDAAETMVGYCGWAQTSHAAAEDWLTIPNFARLPFGQIARLIAGQINRRQYFFVVDAAETMVGYCGWAQ
ncbi:hypothetical protein CNY89_28435, partial [Amaricoccus sp. HAR-UPW-R2A-40]